MTEVAVGEVRVGPAGEVAMGLPLPPVGVKVVDGWVASGRVVAVALAGVDRTRCDASGLETLLRARARQLAC